MQARERGQQLVEQAGVARARRSGKQHCAAIGWRATTGVAAVVIAASTRNERGAQGEQDARHACLPAPHAAVRSSPDIDRS